jgi:arylformamidase
MTPQELDAAYDQSKWAPNMQEVIARYGLLSDAARAAIGEPTRLSYGATDEEGLDFYRADQDRAPIVIFVHGGGWRGGTAREYAFPAEMLLAAGIHFMAMDFSSVLATKGDLSILIDQVRRALAWVWRNSHELGGDASRIYLVGHSSGAHLAGMGLSTRWSDYDVAANPVTGGILISGMYDLGPLRQTTRAEYVRIDDRVEREFSPLHQIAFLKAPLLLSIGSKESPEFRRQAQEYADAVTRSGRQTSVIVGENYNHFEILETLGNPYGLLGRNLLGLIDARGA